MKYVVSWTYHWNGSAAENEAGIARYKCLRSGRRPRARRSTNSSANSTALAGSR